MKFNLAEQSKNLTSDQLERIELVKKEQSKLSMTPRNDSILTYNYAINNVPDYLNTPEKIAQELVIVDYIYNNTNYATIIEDVMREVASHIRFKYRLDWNTTWDIVRFYIPDMLKLYCIRTSNIELPI